MRRWLRQIQRQDEARLDEKSRDDELVVKAERERERERDKQWKIVSQLATLIRLGHSGGQLEMLVLQSGEVAPVYQFREILSSAPSDVHSRWLASAD